MKLIASTGRESVQLKMFLKFVGVCLLLVACFEVHAQVPKEKLPLYFGDWRSAPVHTVYGHLSEQEIFTKGDAANPTAKAAVLRYASSYQHATLAAHSSTSPVSLQGHQQIYFVVAGKGSAVTSSQNIELSSGIALLVPAELRFTLKNTGDAPLEMYMLEENIPAGFHPNTSILVRDENSIPFSTTDQAWSCMVKQIFIAGDGLATLDHVSTISLDPMTISRPEVAPSTDTEAVWTQLEGTSLAFVSNQVIRQESGVSFLEVPDGKTPHSVVNSSSTTQVRFLYFSHKAAKRVDTKHSH